VLDDQLPRCPRCKGEKVNLIRQETSYRRYAKDGALKGVPKLESHTAMYHCEDCAREFAIRIEGD